MKNKILYGTATLAVAIASAIWLSSGGPSHAADKPAAPEVTVAQVVVRPVDDANQYTGRLQAIDTIALRARVSGYVDTVEFTEGALVKKGQLLFRIDPRPYQAEVDRLAANLAQAKSEEALAQANAGRASRLLDQHAVSKEEADRNQTAAASARSQVAATQAALDNARLNRAFTEVRSPIDGRVSNALVTPGNLVTGSDVLTTVVSVNPVYAYFDVDEQSYLKLEQFEREQGGTPTVAMGLANEEGFPHQGRIDFVDNQLKDGGGTIRVRAVFDNANQPYTPGLYARLELRSADKRPRALIDDRAVGTDLSNKFAYVVTSDHKVAYRRIVTGDLVDGLRVVEDGLTAKDQIVVSGLQHVKPGVEVAPKVVQMDTRRTDTTATAPSLASTTH
jgi:multidrug efflux system membrane fusion protein